MQILRMNKLDLFPVICRCYGTQRSPRNYYELLDVSPDCSQKEIRKAFIVLSKKWHPDICGDKGHDKFIKLQEAYNILSKEDTRRQYDMNLKYHTYSPYSSSYTRPGDTFYHRPVYRSRREWEEYMAKGYWHERKPDPKDLDAKISNMMLFCIMCGIIIVTFQFVALNYRLARNMRNLQYQYQRDYNLLKKNIQGLTLEEQLNNFQERYNAAQNKKKEEDEKEK
ncbi:hypothetical protein KPH14_006219 [Odynerus spinipes]|uniref:J domain-containing protein n=1 Tax=Odynerus spinipes TaxID=1348599 RepID=A0AAD9RIS7_9HYME|nr:hypothetical protein KPH14_006219 [Odynerus spinipes]